MFDRIAPRYDLVNRLLSAGTDVSWRRAAVTLLGLREPARVLDLCTGTADLLLEILSRGVGFRGVGLDLSQRMLALGQRKIARAGCQERGFLACGDAERLPFASCSFEGALVAFGIRNVGRRDLALAEVQRVLKPGGVFVVLEFSMPRGALGRVYGWYFRRVLPFLGGLVSGDRGAYSYLPASVGQFPATEEFRTSLEATGFRVAAPVALSLGIAYLYRAEKRSP